MEKLNKKISENGLVYKLIKRTQHTAMFAVYTPETNKVVSYEIWEIPTEGNKEVFIKNDDFGVKYNSSCWTSRKRAEEEYKRLIRKVSRKYKNKEIINEYYNNQ